jgi:purine-nucleoside/S-methyl-5'-thioadenosine phosphorylase / adenosine deaminase
MTTSPVTSETTGGSTAGELRVIGGLPVMTWPAFDAHALDALVTTREGGVSTGRYQGLNLGLLVGDDEAAVLTNRARVAAAIGADLDDFVFCQQSHQPNVEIVTAEHRGRGVRTVADAIARTDALVTAVPGIALAVLAADCVPLVLFDPVAKVLACVHAGWGGTVRGVTPAAVQAMQTLGAQPARIIAGIGPAIAPDRYQVGADVAELAQQAFGDQVDAVIRPDGTGKWLFDLWQANTLQLTTVGVPADQVHLARRDTGPGTPFFSHRSEAPCGRFATVARLRADS